MAGVNVDLQNVPIHFAAHLRKARARLHTAYIVARTPLALKRAVYTMLAVAAALCVASLTLGLHDAYWHSASLIVGLPVVVAALIFVVSIIPELLHRPTLKETAERLDLAAGSQNKIATALSFSQDPVTSPFVAAAIQDGITALQQFAQIRPVTPATIWTIKQNIIALGATAVLMLAAMISFRTASAVDAPDKAVLAAAAGKEAAATQESTRPAVEQKSPSPTAKAVERQMQEQLASASPEALAARQQGNNMMPGSTASTHHQASKGDGGRSNGATRGGGKQNQQASTPPKQSPTDMTQNKKPSANQSSEQASASSSRIGSGRGGNSAVQLPGMEQGLQAANQFAAVEDLDGPATPPDKPNDSEHHGSKQPLLSDRKQAPTRELNISSGKGGGGTGRGGPTPAKKARGTGALLFAVPTPDFIPAPLRPGPSKVQYESASPEPMAGAEIPSADAAARRTPESLQTTSDVSPEWGMMAWRYFQQLHQDENATAAGPSAVATTQTSLGAKP